MKATQMRKVIFTAATVAVHAAILFTTASLVMAASGETGHAADGVLFKDFLYRCLNFAITIGIIVYFVFKPMKKALAERSKKVATMLEEAKLARSEAEECYREAEQKLKTASEDIERVYLAIRQEGEMEREKIIANAQAMAEKIQAEAGRSARQEVENARLQLRGEAASLALKVAEQLIKKNISPEDHDRLLDEYLKNVGELH